MAIPVADQLPPGFETKPHREQVKKPGYISDFKITSSRFVSRSSVIQFGFSEPTNLRISDTTTSKEARRSKATRQHEMEV
jgi:hypothetical protein